MTPAEGKPEVTEDKAAVLLMAAAAFGSWLGFVKILGALLPASFSFSRLDTVVPLATLLGGNGEWGAPEATGALPISLLSMVPLRKLVIIEIGEDMSAPALASPAASVAEIPVELRPWVWLDNMPEPLELLLSARGGTRIPGGDPGSGRKDSKEDEGPWLGAEEEKR